MSDSLLVDRLLAGPISELELEDLVLSIRRRRHIETCRRASKCRKCERTVHPQTAFRCIYARTQSNHNYNEGARGTLCAQCALDYGKTWNCASLTATLQKHRFARRVRHA